MESFTEFQDKKSFTRLVVEGRVPGYSFISKFGENPSVPDSVTLASPADVWEYGGTYQWSTTADIVSLSSSNAADTMPILIKGLDANGDLSTQLVTLQGTTRVALTTALQSVHRMENLTATGQDIVGTVYCYSGTTNTSGVPSGGSVVKAILKPNTNQTQMAIFRVPKDTVAFLEKADIGFGFSSGPSAGTHQVRFHFMVRSQGNVFKVKKTKRMLSTGDTVHTEFRTFHDAIPELSDVKICVSEASVGVAVEAAFDLFLVHKDYLPYNVLTSIGMTP